MRRRLALIPMLSTWMVLTAASDAFASDYHGQITFGGLRFQAR